MFIVLLKFAANRDLAGQFIEGHKGWLQRGFDDGVFQMSGTLRPAAGGVVIAHNTSAQDLHERVSQDPFVVEGVVSAELIEIAPSRASEPLAFLLG
jgi:uncharacterized protein YciI